MTFSPFQINLFFYVVEPMETDSKQAIRKNEVTVIGTVCFCKKKRFRKLCLIYIDNKS